MLGCCGAESQKFRTKDGEVDRERLDQLKAAYRAAGCTEEQLQLVEQCTCPCHQDGMVVMC